MPEASAHECSRLPEQKAPGESAAGKPHSSLFTKNFGLFLGSTRRREQIWIELGIAISSEARSTVEAGEQFTICGEREKRPAISIHIVFEVEHLGKAGAGRFMFCPGAILVLCADEV